MSHWVNWRKRPFCGRSARQTGPIWIALNGSGSSARLMGVVPRERHRQIEAQPEIGEIVFA